MLLIQVPKCSGWIKSKSSPRSSFISVAPVNKAKSSKISFLLIPYIGALITFIFILPLALFIANADSTCCSKSPMINKGLLFFITNSNTDCICLIESTGDSINNTNGLSSSAVFF